MLTRKQQFKYFQLAANAWRAHCKTTGLDPADKSAMNNWRREINLSATGHYSTKEMNPVSDFDRVMLDLAVIANDEFWLDRISAAAERRVQWIVLRQFIPDLEFLEKQPVTWAYIQGICRQAHIPETMQDCPAKLLLKVLQMLDTHIRRLAARQGLELIDLPSGYFRRGLRPADAARAKFRHDHHHHITHHAEAVTA